jgi:GT2 family glycosyltransferase
MGREAADEKYRQWFLQHRATDRFANCGVATTLREEHRVRVSVIMPIYKPNLAWLQVAADSVRNQSYSNWQLLLVADGDPTPEVEEYLNSLLADSRVQYLHSHGRGISAALNCGLNACSGEYTAFVDQDDILETSAFSHVADAIFEKEPNIIYTDEDYVDRNARGHLPLFKPAWSPGLLLSCMYLSHLLVVDTKLAKEIGGFRTAYDGAQDYDLILRLTDRTSSVVHIPRVLYHWRRHEGSTARNSSAKPYAHAAGRNALQETTERRHLNATVRDGPVPNTYRLARIPPPDDSAALIIPTKNPKLLRRLFESLHACKNEIPSNVHVILHCQDGPNDKKIQEVCRQFGAHILEYRGPFNFSLMNNLAAARVSDRYLILLNDDVVVRSDGWLDGLCAPFLRASVGIVGAKLHYGDGTIEHAGVVTGLGDGAGHAGRFQLESSFWPWLGLTRDVSAVTGACLAIRRSLFEELGGLDTRYHNNYNDVDCCLRARAAGFSVVLSTDSVIFHDGGRTRQARTSFRERICFRTEWGSVLEDTDYFYSPNLSRRLETIDLSVPPPMMVPG